MTVLTISPHPDDIEFIMAGTLLLLKKAGCDIHLVNITNGCGGSTTLRPEEIARIRWQESLRSAEILGAMLHPCLVDDLEIFYTQDFIRRVTALVRQVKPDIVLTASLEDYMDDHMNAAKLAVTATFLRGVGNYRSIPDENPVLEERNAVPRDSGRTHRHDAQANKAGALRGCHERDRCKGKDACLPRESEGMARQDAGHGFLLENNAGYDANPRNDVRRGHPIRRGMAAPRARRIHAKGLQSPCRHTSGILPSCPTGAGVVCGDSRADRRHPPQLQVIRLPVIILTASLSGVSLPGWRLYAAFSERW